MTLVVRVDERSWWPNLVGKNNDQGGDFCSKWLFLFNSVDFLFDNGYLFLFSGCGGRQK